MSILLRRLTELEIGACIQDLARLRIEVFKEFPYIYEGSFDYEVNYLRKYLTSKRAALIAAFDEKKVVGVSTCLPLLDETFEVQKPFQKAGYRLGEIFYFGESVLQKNYRGQGIGKDFFIEREKWVQTFGSEYQITTFCAVERPDGHNLKPIGYKDLNDFWKTRGYLKNPELTAEFSWLDVGETKETDKKMVFWLKDWRTST